MGFKKLSELPANGARIVNVKLHTRHAITGDSDRRTWLIELSSGVKWLHLVESRRDAHNVTFLKEIERINLLPDWIKQPQPERSYDGPVSPHYDRAVRTSKILPHAGRYFLVFCEGEQCNFVDEDTWKEMKCWVPMYGERIGDRMVIWDRIMNDGKGAYREYTVSDADMRHAGMDLAIDLGSTDHTAVAITEVFNAKVEVRDVIVVNEASHDTLDAFAYMFSTPSYRAGKSWVNERLEAARQTIARHIDWEKALIVRAPETVSAYNVRRAVRIAKRRRLAGESVEPFNPPKPAAKTVAAKKSRGDFFGGKIPRIDRILRY